MNHTPLDIYDTIPKEMRAYLQHNGWHFNKKSYDFATKLMENKDGKVKPYTKEEVDTLLTAQKIELKKNVGYDAAYVATMCKADYLRSSVPDEPHLALFVKDTIDDVDAADGTVMRRWYASMVAAGIPVDWEELL